MTEEITKDETITEESQEGKTDSGEEKKFTQADVDRIVKERLARNKADLGEEEQKKLEEAQASITEKEQELVKRESKLECEKYIIENRYHAGLMEILNTDDPEDFKRKADIAVNTIGLGKKAPAPLANPEPAGCGSVVDGFSRDYKRTPKDYSKMNLD